MRPQDGIATELMMPQKSTEKAIAKIEQMIFEVRGQKVILDADLAKLYGVETKQLNQAVKHNLDKFPDDFAFLLTNEELTTLRSQIVTSNENKRSQIVTSSERGGRRYLPYVFTEHGAIMAANVLRSPKAVQMSVFVVRAFVKMRQMLIAQQDLARKLANLEKKLSKRLDAHESAIVDVLRQLLILLNPPEEPEPPRKEIGDFRVKEKWASYRTKKAKKKKA